MPQRMLFSCAAFIAEEPERQDRPEKKGTASLSVYRVGA